MVVDTVYRHKAAVPDPGTADMAYTPATYIKQARRGRSAL